MSKHGETRCSYEYSRRSASVSAVLGRYAIYSSNLALRQVVTYEYLPPVGLLQSTNDIRMSDNRNHAMLLQRSHGVLAISGLLCSRLCLVSKIASHFCEGWKLFHTLQRYVL